MVRKILAIGDFEDQDRARRKPQRELIFYGAIRRGFEDALQGLAQVEKACKEFSVADQENVKLERYCMRMERLAEEIHKMYIKANRVKVSTGG